MVSSYKETVWYNLSCMQQTSTKNFGKIQGDGRKFLQRFKSYLGSKISQSLNEIHIYRLQPKSANVSFFHFHFCFCCCCCLWLSVWVGACCPLTFDLVSQKQRERFLSADFGKTIVLTTRRSQFAKNFRTFSVVFNCRSLFKEAAYLAALRRLRSPFAIHDAN